jgi:hypothetical protein
LLAHESRPARREPARAGSEIQRRSEHKAGPLRGTAENLRLLWTGFRRSTAEFYGLAYREDVDLLQPIPNPADALHDQKASEILNALWPHLLSLYPDFDEYQARTDRDIPVFRCTATG